MHHAPSVTYPVGRSVLFGLLLAGAWLLGAVLVGWWCLGVPAVGWRQWLGLSTLPVAALAAWVSWRRMGVGMLRWDGQVWLWQAKRHRGDQSDQDALPVQLGVHLDLQRQLMLCLQPQTGPSVWCWADRARMPERWGDLRRAVYSPARSQAVSDDAPVPPVVPVAPASPEP
ncbi:MAG: hypothetical protein JWP29_2759 [Rhodoferax sp.]|nr:hypothetical protein [Rhodoferax sp.]